MTPALPIVKVKRDGPKGWHWINARDFDPAKHELVEPASIETVGEPPPAESQPKRRGRPPKRTE